MGDNSEVCCRVVHISDLFSRHAFAEATIHSHDGLHRQILISHVLLSLLLCYLCCVSTWRSVSSARSGRQLGRSPPSSRRSADMAKCWLINRRQFLSQQDLFIRVSCHFNHSSINLDKCCQIHLTHLTHHMRRALKFNKSLTGQSIDKNFHSCIHCKTWVGDAEGGCRHIPKVQHSRRTPHIPGRPLHAH